ncbi:MAG: glycosyl transferase family 1 [Firmicutes bacterium HGW-Firmicutes-1]|nr:MAG: glycosyl transferase family 1 [Firmicutes bacterium HGW-Firmicutes-1]
MQKSISEKFILILSQRDISHPAAGGAEKYLHKAISVLAEKEKIIHLGCAFDGCKKEEIIDGVQYVRHGKNLFTVIFYGIKFYLHNRRQVLMVIDHSNTHQFFTFLWVRKKRVFFIHQLALDIWPYYFGKIGNIFWVLEELLIRLSRGRAITVSESTKNDLASRKFKEIYVVPEGNDIVCHELPSDESKQDYLLYVGRMVPYKRVEDAILVAAKLEKKLIIIGRGPKKYTDFLKVYAEKVQADCEFLGFISKEEKTQRMKDAYLLLMPSIREGWGLVITESSNLGTPSVVYNVNGVIEAVNYGKAGYIAKNMSVEGMLEVIRDITPEGYKKIREDAFDYSLKFTWEQTAQIFADTIHSILQ